MTQLALRFPTYQPVPEVAEAIRQYEIAENGQRRWKEREKFRATYEQLKRETGN